MSSVTGTGALLRLALRRDRILLPVWIVVFAGTAAVSASATVDFYPSVESRVVAAEAANNMASLVAFYGRIYDPTSLGALSMLKMSVMGAALVAVLMIIVMIRHTRAEEEAGRLELVEAGVVGRSAALTAALILSSAACLVLGVCTAAGLIATGLPIDGSITFGLAWSMVGIVFATVAGVAAQLARSARAAIGLSLIVLGVSYLMRAVADASGGTSLAWLSWCSPLGLGQHVQAFAGNQWWVLLILVGLAAGLTATAFLLSARRDLGAGVFADRPGPEHAGKGLAGPFGLAWNLARNVLLAWLVGVILMGALLGNIASNASSMLESQQARDFITKLGGTAQLTDAFLATEMGFMGFIAAAYGIQATLRLRSEETSLHAEPLLATALTRLRWALSHITVALVGSAAILLATGLAAGWADGAQTGDMTAVGRVLLAAAVQVPAAWILVGVVVLLFGLLPQFVRAGWIVLVAFLLLAEVGPLLQLSPTVIDVSPFAHIPRLPGGEFAASPLIALTVIAVLLTAVGLAGFRRRDVDSPG